MNHCTSVSYAFLVSVLVAGATIPAQADLSGEDTARVRFVCQAYDRFDHEFRNRVMILEQTSTRVLDKYSNLDLVDGLAIIDLNSEATYMGMTGTAEFRMRFYIASLISEEETDEEMIEQLMKNNGDYRVAQYEFQDAAPMDYLGTGYRDESTFYFNYQRQTDAFSKQFDFDLSEFYENELFDIDRLRDFDTDALEKLIEERTHEQESVSPYPYVFPYPYVSTAAGSSVLMEDGTYICRKPDLI